MNDEWMLDKGEKVQIRQWEVLPTDCIEATAKAQARKIVKYIENNLFCLGTDEGYIVLKEEWEQFKKEVGDER